MILSKILATSLMLGSFALFNDCAPINNSPTPPHPTPVVIDTDQCGAAETNLHSLCNADPVKNSYCCQVVAPTKKGKSYTQFCQDKQLQGVFLNPKCVSSVTSCEQIDACTNSK
jgi:hypothetical protein